MSITGGTFTSKLLKGSFLLSMSSFFIRLVGLATTIMVLHSLGLAEYGLYKLVLATSGVFIGLLLGGFDALVVNEAIRQNADGNHGMVKKLFLEFVGMKFSIGLLLFTLVQVGSPLLLRWIDPGVVALLPIVSYQFLFIALERPMGFIFNFFARFRPIALMPLLDESMKFSLVLFFVAHLGWQAYGVLLADVLATGFVVLLFVPHALSLGRKIVAVEGERGSPLWWIIRTYGKWAIAGRYLDEVRKSIRPWLIKFFLGTEAVAIYALAESFVGQVATLVPLSSVFAPLLPRELKNRERVRNLVIVGTKYGTPLFIAIAAAAAVAVPSLILFLFPSYTPSIPIFLIMIIGVSTTAFASVITSVLYAERRQRAQFFITLTTVLFMVLAGAYLVRTFGLLGMAFEFLITMVFYNSLKLVSLLSSCPELRFRPSELFSWSEKDRQFIHSLKSSSQHRLQIFFSHLNS